MGLTLRLAREAFEAFGREYNNVLSARIEALGPWQRRREAD